MGDKEKNQWFNLPFLNKLTIDDIPVTTYFVAEVMFVKIIEWQAKLGIMIWCFQCWDSFQLRSPIYLCFAYKY